MKPKSELWIYLLGPEDEFYLSYDFWSDPMPELFKHDKDTIFQDVLIKKTNYKARKECVSRNEVSYIGRKRWLIFFSGKHTTHMVVLSQKFHVFPIPAIK